LHTLLTDHAADRLDPETTGPQLVDKSADQWWRGSAKSAREAVTAVVAVPFPGRFSNPACMTRPSPVSLPTPYRELTTAAMATYAHDQIDQTRAGLNAVSE
jgi:hypothetical protein